MTSSTDKAKEKGQLFISEIDHAELTTRLIEIGCHMKRPPGKTGQEALEGFRRQARAGIIPAYIVQDFENMAKASIEYFGECVQNMQARN